MNRKETMPYYTYEKLVKIYDDLLFKSKAGKKLSRKEMLLGSAAGHAIDFCDVAKDIEKPLDLTVKTEDNVVDTLMKTCGMSLQRKKNPDEVRKEMIKKFASYELFAIVNTFIQNSDVAEIVIQPGPTMNPKLAIQVSNSNRKKEFDVFAAAEAAISKFKFFDPADLQGMRFLGTLKPFYDRLTDFIQSLDM